MVLGFICWNIVGLLLGFLADKLAHRPGDDPRPTLVAGAAGAALAGMLYGRFSAAGVKSSTAAASSPPPSAPSSFSPSGKRSAGTQSTGEAAPGAITSAESPCCVGLLD